jgi:hypothetical protein
VTQDGGVPRQGHGGEGGGVQGEQVHPQEVEQVQPAPPKKFHAMFVTDKISFTNVENHLRHVGEIDGNHSLRLYTHKDGRQELYIHHEGKLDNVFERGAKREGARDLVKQMLVDRVGDAKAQELLEQVGVGSKVRVDQFKRLKVLVERVERDERRALQVETDRQNRIDRIQEYQDHQVEGGDKQRLQGWSEGRVQALVRIGSPEQRGERLQQFNDGRLHLDPSSQVSLSSTGSGGVMMVKDGEGARQCVLKVEGKMMIDDARFISNLTDHVVSHSNSPLPFDFPMHQVVSLPKPESGVGEQGLFRDAPELQLRFEQTGNEERLLLESTLTRLKDDPDRGDKVGDYQKALEDNGGLVSKYEWLDGKALDQLSFNDKITLLKLGDLPRDLGSASVLLPFMQLRDHVKLDGTGGNVNLANFMWGEDGRLKVFDFSTESSGQERRGNTDEQLLRGVGELVEFLNRAVGTDDPKGILEGNHSLSTVMDALFSPGPVGGGAFFNNTQMPGVDDLLGPEGRDKALATLISGALQGLSFLKENLDVIAGAHGQDGVREQSGIGDVVGSFGRLRDMLDGVDLGELTQRFNQKFEQYLTPSLGT